MDLPRGAPHADVAMVSASCDWRDRYPIGGAEEIPSCRDVVEVYRPLADSLVVPGPRGGRFFRIPAVHSASGAPAVLLAPSTVISPGVVFRDCPEFEPVSLDPWPDVDWTDTVYPSQDIVVPAAVMCRRQE